MESTLFYKEQHNTRIRKKKFRERSEYQVESHNVHTEQKAHSFDLSKILDAQLNRGYEIATNYGTVQGRVVFIGTDYLEVIESTLSTVLVPYENIVSISPL